jgi:RNA polymerase sigma-70 factor, ECF subfamily
MPQVRTSDADDGFDAEPSHPRVDLDELARRTRPTIEKYVARRVDHRDDRDDVIGDVFVALARSWEKFRGDCPADLYVLRIASNRVKNYWRDRGKRPLVSFDDDFDERLKQGEQLWCPQEAVDRRFDVEGLVREMRVACSAEQCSVLEQYYQGIPFDEIATVLGIKPTTARVQLLRGRLRLLVHLLVRAPDFLGGSDGVEAAIRKLESSTGEPLSRIEAEAVRLRNGPADVLQGAMLKLAPYFSFLLLVGLGGAR